MITKELKAKIKEHAKSEAPKECCGFILENGKIYRAQNTSMSDNKFSINAADYITAKSLSAIKAVYHSHPNGGATFSEFDKFNSINHGVIYVLYSMKDNSFSQFDPALTTFNKYIGRKFEIGETDCFALIKDFYEFELNIKLNEHHRDEGYEDHLGELFNVDFEAEGFSPVDEPRKYDCILFREKKGRSSNHIALYLGDGLMLHQPRNSYSRIESYLNAHRRHTNHFIRYKNAEFS